MKWLKPRLLKAKEWLVEKQRLYARRRDKIAAAIASVIVAIIFSIKDFTTNHSKKLRVLLILVFTLFALYFFLVRVPQHQVQSLRAKFNESDINKLEPKERIQLEKDLFASESNARMAIAQIIGGAFVLLGLYLTYKNIRVAEEGKLTERFSKAVELLGNDKLDVKLGGIHALERIAWDSQKDHWTVVEVLTAFIKEQSRKEYKSNILTSPDFSPSLEPMDVDFTLREDIQAALTVIGRRKWVEQERQLYNRIDLSKSFLGKAVLYEANLSGVYFFSTNLTNAILFKANLSGTDFSGAILLHTKLDFANLSEARFDNAYLRGANLSTSTGLTWEQLSEAIIDETTKLPPELEERRKAEQAEQAKKAAAPNQ
jgi:hypothetical protein